jgi:hypothetical protein
MPQVARSPRQLAPVWTLIGSLSHAADLPAGYMAYIFFHRKGWLAWVTKQLMQAAVYITGRSAAPTSRYRVQQLPPPCACPCLLSRQRVFAAS